MTSVPPTWQRRPVPSRDVVDPLNRLRQTLANYRSRYGDRAASADVDRLDAAVARRRARMRHLDSQIAELAEEVERLETEVQGIEKGLGLLLESAIEDIRARHQEGWSPFPIYGYRVWAVTAEGLVGARTLWRTPLFEASCDRHRGTDEVPHSDGRCGRLGCGVYAVKQAAPMLDSFIGPEATRWAAGLVALSGKVVEHELGYRAELAEVVALYAVHERTALATNDPGTIARVFAGPEDVIEKEGNEYPGGHVAVLSFLEDQTRRFQPWTSESKSA